MNKILTCRKPISLNYSHKTLTYKIFLFCNWFRGNEGVGVCKNYELVVKFEYHLRSHYYFTFAVSYYELLDHANTS